MFGTGTEPSTVEGKKSHVGKPNFEVLGMEPGLGLFAQSQGLHH